MNLANPIRYWHLRSPDVTAFHLPDRRIPWSEFDTRTSRLASAMQSRGVLPGDRVAILSPNCIEFCETVVASLKIAAAVVPLNFRLAPREIIEILRRCGPSLLIGEAGLVSAVSTEAGSRGEDLPPIVVIGGVGEQDYEHVMSTGAPVDPDVPVRPEDPAFICFTSGTTGLPKGAVLSHRNVLATAMERMVCDGWDWRDVGFIPYAIAFTGGLVSMWMPLYVAGSAVVLEPAFEPDRALELIARLGITAFIAVPAVWEAMAQAPGFEAADLSTLTTAATGGSYISDALIRTYAAKGVALAQQYGLTEGGGLNLITPRDQALTRIGWAGLPTPQGRVRIVDDAGAEVARGTVGELVLQGPQVMERYWDDPAATQAALAGGWLRTGDLALMDDEGYVRIVDRKKDMLISGGINIYPAEIERVLGDVPHLMEYAVIGVADPKWGEVPAVIARRAGPVTAEDILAACRRDLGSYKVPRYVFFQDEALPRSMSGKVMKRELGDHYASMVDAERGRDE
jgi:fatty-acyl-CoA synthase